jgi:hypothetical protein
MNRAADRLGQSEGRTIGDLVQTAHSSSASFDCPQLVATLTHKPRGKWPP